MSGDDDTPVRDHMDREGIKWRHGSKPDYTLINKLYMSERTRKHKPGSLEKIAENLVKTWEMEASHKTEPKVRLPTCGSGRPLHRWWSEGAGVGL